MSTDRGRAWRRVAAAVAAERPHWQTTRPGRPDLVRVPVGWWLVRVGCTGRGRLYLFAATMPLTLPPSQAISSYGGFLQDQYGERHDRTFPRWFDPEADDAVELLGRWLDEAVEPMLAGNHAPAQWAHFREQRFTHSPDQPPRTWPMLAGWRLLVGSDPLPVIDATLAHIADGRANESSEPFFRELRARVLADRSGAQAWLDQQRRAWLAGLGVQPDQITDDPPTTPPTRVGETA